MNACNFAKIAFHDEYVPGTLMIITLVTPLVDIDIRRSL